MRILFLYMQRILVLSIVLPSILLPTVVNRKRRLSRCGLLTLMVDLLLKHLHPERLKYSSSGSSNWKLQMCARHAIFGNLCTYRLLYTRTCYDIAAESLEKQITSELTAGLWSRSPRLGLGRQTSRSRLRLGHLRLVPKTNFRPNCAGHINITSQLERSVNRI